ncbi:MAG: 2-oxoacid:ferredoxin oxidoreductase subunit beta, partial [Gammaproteobacteria bacterium]
ADVGSKAKQGEVNQQPPIDPVVTALTLGGSFVARSFSGDKAQLVPLIKAGIMHNGFAMLDVLSPCVTFNDHEDSTKSYAHTRQFYHPAVHADFVPPRKPIRAAYDDGEAMLVELHDGSTVLLRKVSRDYNPTDRAQAYSYLHNHQKRGEIVTGLLYIDEDQREMHDISNTVSEALRDLPYEELCPGAKVLEEIQNLYR